MAENYKHQYEQMKLMVEKYQDELIPGFRAEVEQLLTKCHQLEQKWIPVTERLPERNAEVLVCDTREDYVSIWEHIGDGLWFGNEVIWATEDITHWMPLPEPPKGE